MFSAFIIVFLCNKRIQKIYIVLLYMKFEEIYTINALTILKKCNIIGTK